MTSSTPLAIASRRVVTPGGTIPATIVVRNGTVETVLPYDATPSDLAKVDYGDLVVMPGLIDPHVHINEPGRTEWEGFRTATRAAAAGGVTTLIDMPLNSVPVTTNVRALEQKVTASEGNLFVDCGFYGGLIPSNRNDLPSLITAGVFGIKAFLIESGIDEFPAADATLLNSAMPVIAKSHVPLLVHAELRTNAVPLNSEGDPRDYRSFARSRPVAWETDAIDLVARLARKHRCWTHIVHLSTAQGLNSIRVARRDGVYLTTETCPHYLYFDAESIERGATLLKCTPPIRDRANNEQLLQALVDGDIDFVASDHSPAPPSLKSLDVGDFSAAWGGIASLQLRLPVVWTMVRDRGVTLQQVSQWLTEVPARFLGISSQKGVISSGMLADLVIWDPESSFEIEPTMLQSRHQLSPYVGETLFGRVRATYLRGAPIFDDGAFSGPLGRPLFRSESEQ